MTKEEILAYVDQSVWIETRVREVACKVIGIRKLLWKERPESAYIRYEFTTTGTIMAYFEEWSRGETDHEEIEFPIWYLWTEGFEDTETAWWAECERVRIERAKAAELQQAAAIKLSTEAKERELYERLKAKFECH